MGAGDLQTALDLLDMPGDLVAATAELEEFRRSEELAIPAEVEVPFYMSDEGKIRLATARELYRRETILGDLEAELRQDPELAKLSVAELEAVQLGRILQELEVPAAIADAIVDYEEARR